MILKVIFLAIISIQFFINMYLFSIIEHQEEENAKYFKKLRKDYDIKLEELKKDIEVRDEIIEASAYNKVRS